MKRTIIHFSFIALFCLVGTALHAQSSPANLLSAKIADKMRDTLGLSNGQRGQVFSVNMRLHNDKKAKREQYQNRDSLTRHLQLVENRRDTLYRPILTQSQYILYKQKKRNLVRAD